MFFTPNRRLVFILASMLVLISAFTIAFASRRVPIGPSRDTSHISIEPTASLNLSTPSSTMQAVETLVTTGSISTGNVDLSTDPNLQQVNELTGWIIKTPTFLPEGYHFDSAYYDSTNQIVYLTFLATRQLPGTTLTETKSLTLVEAKHNNVAPLMVSPNAKLENALVAGKSGAYAIGAWDSNFVQNGNEPNSGHMEWIWRNDLPVQNIFWQNEGLYLVLATDDGQTSKSDLLKTADSTK